MNDVIIPTEPIGSIPRPLRLIEAITAAGNDDDPAIEPLFEAAVRDTIERFEATGSPVITDGEQRKVHNFWTYSVQGLANTAPDGFAIPFNDGHVRRMPRLVRGPFRYRRYSDSYLDAAMRHARVPVKQAVISPSALSLMYPPEGISGYPREAFIDDLLREHETEVRRCLQKGAHSVQIDFTEGRLAMKIDPGGDLLESFIDLNNLALSRFSAQDRKLDSYLNQVNQFVEYGYEVYSDQIELKDWWTSGERTYQHKIYFKREYSTKPLLIFTANKLKYFSVRAPKESIKRNSIVISAGEDGVVRVWNGTNGQEIVKFLHPIPPAETVRPGTVHLAEKNRKPPLMYGMPKGLII